MKRRFVKERIIVTLLGLLLFIIVLEIGIHIGGFMHGFLQEYRNKMSIKKRGSHCILCLGDSVTNMWPSYLEEIINKKSKKEKFTVINKAKPGIDSAYIIYILRKNLDAYKPDIVITMIGYNDLAELLPYGNIPVYDPHSQKVQLKVYKLLKLLWYNAINKIHRDSYPLPTPGPVSSGRGEVKEERHSSITSTYSEQAKLYEKTARYKEAQMVYIKAIENEPGNYIWYYEAGLMSDLCVEYDKAEEFLKIAKRMNPHDERIYVRLGMFYLIHKKDYDKAEKELRKAFEINPANGEGVAYLGWVYIKSGRYSEAKEILEKAIALNPKDNLKRMKMIVSKELREKAVEDKYCEELNKLQQERYNPMTLKNYRELKRIVLKRGIKLIAAQYPMRSVEPLKRMVGTDSGVIFVDNEKIFKEALKKGSYDEYFIDMFAGDFGHCAQKGERLLAENIANVILKECFNE